jgi:hypothetical protein
MRENLVDTKVKTTKHKYHNEFEEFTSLVERLRAVGSKHWVEGEDVGVVERDIEGEKWVQTEDLARIGGSATEGAEDRIVCYVYDSHTLF